jgi:integrase
MTEDICTELVHRPDFPNPITLLQVWRDYIHEHARRKGQDIRAITYTAKHWMNVMGIDADPGKWKRADVRQFEDARRADGVTSATIRREMCLQQAALNHALKWERLERVCYFEKPSGEGQKRRPLTEEEYARLMRSPLPRRIRMFYILAYWTGHRARAIETLPWSRVNFEARTIDFNEPGARRTNKRRVDGFPIPDELLPRLEAAYAHPRRDEYVIGAGPRGKVSTTYHAAKAAMRAVGIDEDGICRHTVRKTFVTERIKAGANPEKVAALIADNPVTMRKHYSILLTEDLRATANMRAAA